MPYTKYPSSIVHRPLSIVHFSVYTCNEVTEAQLPPNLQKLKVVIVCDWLTGIGGAERVVLQLHQMFPTAPIYTSQYDPSAIDWFKEADVRTLWLQKLPKGLKKFLPPLRAWAFSRLDLSQYDLIISNSGAEAKAIKFGPKTRHICILNTPTHYYWRRYQEYLQSPGFPKGTNWLAKLALQLLVVPLRRWDKSAAQKPTQIVAISKHIQSDIKEYYGRDSVIIHPPVEVARFAKRKDNELRTMDDARSGIVVTGRQTPYKRIDLAVAACTQMNLPLTVIGNGPEHQNLLKLAGPSIKFFTDASDEDVVRLVSTSQAFIFPGLDDFGIAAVEALAAGTPVIAYRGGGALDYIKEELNGLFFDQQTVENLKNTLQKFLTLSFNNKVVTKSAQKFTPEIFRQSILNLLNFGSGAVEGALQSKQSSEYDGGGGRSDEAGEVLLKQEDADS